MSKKRMDKNKEVVVSSVEDVVSKNENVEKRRNFLFPPVTGSNLDLDEIRSTEIARTCKVTGEEEKGVISIMPAKGERGYSSDTYDVFLGVAAVWHKQGRPEGIVETTTGEIIEGMHQSKSGWTYKKVLGELQVMKYTNVKWVKSFQTKKGEKENGEQVTKDEYLPGGEAWSVLGSLSWDDSMRGQSIPVRFEIPVHIIENYLANLSIPSNVKMRMKLRSSVHKAIFTRIDTMLYASANGYVEQNVTTLFDEHYLDMSRYSKPSKRKDWAETVARNLNGLETSKGGDKMLVTVEKGNKDWKLVFKLAKVNEPRPKPAAVNDDDMVEWIVTNIGQIAGNGKKNRRYYKLIARAYHWDHINMALADTKELVDKDPSSDGGKLFRYFMHVLSHDPKLNYEWIEDCGVQCKKRPENSLPLLKS